MPSHRRSTRPTRSPGPSGCMAIRLPATPQRSSTPQSTRANTGTAGSPMSRNRPINGLIGPGFGNPDFPDGDGPHQGDPRLHRGVPRSVPGRGRADHGGQLGQGHRGLRANASSRRPGSTTTLRASPTPSPRPNARVFGRSSRPAASNATRGRASVESASASSACSPTTGRQTGSHGCRQGPLRRDETIPPTSTSSRFPAFAASP